MSAATEPSEPQRIQRPLAHRSARDELHSIPDPYPSAITSIIHQASTLRHPAEHPRIDTLHDGDLYRIRVGKWRAVIDYHMGRIRLLRVGHRERIYDESSMDKARCRRYDG